MGKKTENDIFKGVNLDSNKKQRKRQEGRLCKNKPPDNCEVFIEPVSQPNYQFPLNIKWLLPLIFKTFQLKKQKYQIPEKNCIAKTNNLGKHELIKYIIKIRKTNNISFIQEICATLQQAQLSEQKSRQLKILIECILDSKLSGFQLKKKVWNINSKNKSKINRVDKFDQQA